MGQWTIPGPDKLTLTKEEVLSMLHMKEGTFDRMVKTGRFPRGLKTSPGAEPIWTAVDIAAYLHLSHRLVADEEEEPRDGPARKGEK